MTLKLNTRYVLTNPQGVTRTITINNAADVSFYTKYKEQDGYTFEEYKEDTIKPRIHISDSACVSCEG